VSESSSAAMSGATARMAAAYKYLIFNTISYQ
jgi:hypothetical protein